MHVMNSNLVKEKETEAELAEDERRGRPSFSYPYFISQFLLNLIQVVTARSHLLLSVVFKTFGL